MKLSTPKTLASRLTLWYSLIFMAVFGAAYLLSYFSIEAVLNSRFEEDLEEDIEEIGMLFQSNGIEAVKAEIERELSSEDPKTLFFRLLNAQGNPLYSSDLSNWSDVDLDNKTLSSITSGNGPVFGEASLVEDDQNSKYISGFIGKGIILQVGESLEEKEEIMELLSKIFLLTFVVLIGPAALIGRFMAKKSLQGVEAVSQATMDVANGTLNRYVSVKERGEEIERLVVTFNLMVDRIRKLIFGMREMTDNIAHDLRSPLARIRVNAEAALSSAKTIEEHQASAADTIEECDRLLRLINATLDVAEVEAGAAELVKEDVNLCEIIQDACELFEPLAEDKEIKLLAQLGSDCHIKGNTPYLQRMLANLLDNALKCTQPNGAVDVSLSTNNNIYLISVKDTGPGITYADQTRIFNRFFRCDKSRSQDGCGMGLSFARAVARAHGGDIKILSEPGKGSLFAVTLPV